MTFHAKLGIALDHVDGPLTHVENGHRFAVWPAYANGLLLVGSTGNGKSSLLRYMTTNLVRPPLPPQGIGIHLADGKFSGAFLMFRSVPGVVDIAGQPADITGMVRGYFDEVERRYRALSEAREQAWKTRGKPEYQTPGPLYLIIDEYLNWVLALPEKERKDVIAKLTRIGSIGREVGCALAIATQRPGTKEVDTGLPGLLKAQLKCRVASSGLLGLDSIETRMVFDDDSIAARLPSRLGAGMVKVGKSEMAFFTPWMPDPTIDEDAQFVWDLLPAPVDHASA